MHMPSTDNQFIHLVGEAMGKLTNTVLAAIGVLALLGGSQALAGGKIKIDDTKWISLGIGGRASYSAVQDSAPNGSDWSNQFNLDNARIYIAGQVHKYVKFELNTECVFCGNSGSDAAHEEFVVLDAIAKIEINPYFNIWGGTTPCSRRTAGDEWAVLLEHLRCVQDFRSPYPRSPGLHQ